MQSGSAIAVYLAVIAGISLVGGVAPLVRTWSRENLTLLVSTGAGVLLGAAFVHMVPLTAEGLGRAAGLPILAGFLAIFILEQFFLVDPCEEVGCEIHSFGFAAFLGITFHSLIDGVAVGSSLIVPELAPPVLLAIVLHKIPAAFSLCSILLLAVLRYVLRTRVGRWGCLPVIVLMAAGGFAFFWALLRLFDAVL